MYDLTISHARILRWDLNSPATYSLQELGEALVDNSLDDFTVDIRQPDTHQGAQHQQERQNIYVACLSASPWWKDYADEFVQTLPKYSVHITSSFPWCLLKNKNAEWIPTLETESPYRSICRYLTLLKATWISTLSLERVLTPSLPFDRSEALDACFLLRVSL